MPKFRTTSMTRVALSALGLTGAVVLGTAGAALAQGRVNTGDGTHALPQPTPAEVDKGAAAIKLPADLKIPAEWVPLLNRAYEEYWMEGDHRPDAGFVLFARDPSKETAKLWLLRMESKAKNLEQLFVYVRQAQNELVHAGLMEDRFGMVAGGARSGAATLPAPQAGVKPAAQDELQALEFFFLFSPTCPHCARLAETLIGFPNVRPLQVTEGPVKNWPGLPPSDRATPETLNTYAQSGEVPVLVVFHRPSNRLLKIAGARSAQEILVAAGAVLEAGRVARGNQGGGDKVNQSTGGAK